MNQNEVINLSNKATVFYTYNMETYTTYNNENGNIISESFAKKMNVEIGDRLMFYGPWGQTSFVYHIFPDNEMPYKQEDGKVANVVLNASVIAYKNYHSNFYWKIYYKLLGLLTFFKCKNLAQKLFKKDYVIIPKPDGLSEDFIVTEELNITKGDKDFKVPEIDPDSICPAYLWKKFKVSSIEELSEEDRLKILSKAS